MSWIRERAFNATGMTIAPAITKNKTRTAAVAMATRCHSFLLPFTYKALSKMTRETSGGDAIRIRANGLVPIPAETLSHGSP